MRVRQERRASLLRQYQESIAHVAGALEIRERASPRPFPRQEAARPPFKERDLIAKRPRPKHLPKGVRRRLGDEPRFVDAGVENVAAAATADEDLPSAIRRSLEQACLGAG
jgi:hypothetical protein